MAEQAVSSKMYASNFKEKSGVIMVMLAARELGIPPMQALNGGINIIQGKVEISARMMSALIRKSGHQIIVKESTDTSCTLQGKRCDTGESQAASFTLQDAQRAGLVKPGGGWTKFPKDMCFARALSRLARQLFSDVIGIGYVEGEIKAIEAELIVADEPQEDEQSLVAEYVKIFQPEDEFLCLEYAKMVQKHFGWDTIYTLKELIKDEKKLLEKFISWKNKQTKVEEKK